jgi:hypothetical protein
MVKQCNVVSSSTFSFDQNKHYFLVCKPANTSQTTFLHGIMGLYLPLMHMTSMSLVGSEYKLLEN